MRIQSEFLSPDILEPDFLSPFVYHFFAQTIFCSSRVTAKYQFVTGPTTSDKIITIGVCSAVALIYCITRESYVKIHGPFQDAYILGTMGTTAKAICHFTHLLKVRLFDDNTAVEMLVKLNEVDRHLGIQKTKILRQMMKAAALSRFSLVIVIISTYIISTIFNPIPNVTLIIMCSSWSLCTFWLEISLCSLMAVMFLSKVKYFNALLRTQLIPKSIRVSEVEQLRGWQRLKIILLPLNDKVMDRLVPANAQNIDSNNADIQLTALLKGFELYRRAFQFQVRF